MFLVILTSVRIGDLSSVILVFVLDQLQGLLVLHVTHTDGELC